MTKSNEPSEKFYKERTEVVVGAQEIIERNLQCLSDTVYQWSNLTDSIGPVTFNKVEAVKEAYANALEKVLKLE